MIKPSDIASLIATEVDYISTIEQSLTLSSLFVGK